MGRNALTNDQKRTICLYKKTILLQKKNISDYILQMFLKWIK
jgi:hypothetical protein